MQLYVDAKKVGDSILPLEKPGKDPAQNETGEWEIDLAEDIKANLIENGQAAHHKSPYLAIGCHHDGSKYMDFARPHTAFDELTIWTRKLEVNRTHNEVEYFLGGYPLPFKKQNDSFKYVHFSLGTS